VYQRQHPHTKQRTSILLLVVSCRVVSCRVVSCRVVSCRVVSCRVVSCRVVCVVSLRACIVVLSWLGHSCRGEALVRASDRVLQEERPARAQRRYKSGHTNELGRYRCLSSHSRDVMLVSVVMMMMRCRVGAYTSFSFFFPSFSLPRRIATLRRNQCSLQ
jgi:hypothetical protein